jgi:pimeloyl-ACP methyl ester carboxylesterase
MTPEEARAVAIELQGYGYAIPRPVTEEWLVEAASRGMIRKADLVDGGTYIGCCRNAYVARWYAADHPEARLKRVGTSRGVTAPKGAFVHLREKLGDVFATTIKHPEDDDKYDLFVPTLLILPPLE